MIFRTWQQKKETKTKNENDYFSHNENDNTPLCAVTLFLPQCTFRLFIHSVCMWRPHAQPTNTPAPHTHTHIAREYKVRGISFSLCAFIALPEGESRRTEMSEENKIDALKSQFCRRDSLIWILGTCDAAWRGVCLNTQWKINLNEGRGMKRQWNEEAVLTITKRLA